MTDNDLRALERAWRAEHSAAPFTPSADVAFERWNEALGRAGQGRRCWNCRDGTAATTEREGRPLCGECLDVEVSIEHDEGAHEGDEWLSTCPRCQVGDPPFPERGELPGLDDDNFDDRYTAIGYGAGA